jgi:hypothetical protein
VKRFTPFAIINTYKKHKTLHSGHVISHIHILSLRHRPGKSWCSIPTTHRKTDDGTAVTHDYSNSATQVSSIGLKSATEELPRMNEFKQGTSDSRIQVKNEESKNESRAKPQAKYLQYLHQLVIVSIRHSIESRCNGYPPSAPTASTWATSLLRTRLASVWPA